MPSDILSVLELTNPDGWALALPGPDGEDRLRTVCRVCSGGGTCRNPTEPCEYCDARGYLPTQNLCDVLEAARLKWRSSFFFTFVNGVFVLVVNHATLTGRYRAAADTTIETAMLSCIRQALEAEGATP